METILLQIGNAAQRLNAGRTMVLDTSASHVCVKNTKKTRGPFSQQISLPFLLKTEDQMLRPESTEQI